MNFEKSWKIVPLLLILSVAGLVFFYNTAPATAVSGGELSNQVIEKYGLIELVNEIEEVHCGISDDVLVELKLSEENIRKKNEFCNLTREEKINVLVNEYQKIDSFLPQNGVISGFANSYSCYWDGINLGIPTYQDLGLSASSCSWADPNPVCKNQGGVACLWGCTNKDPVLGWKSKSFTSKAALESAIIPKGYFQANTGYYSGLSYTRQLPYGYRYEVQGPSSGSGTFITEGPEPDPSFNWYAFTNMWYPVEVAAWHVTC